MQKKKDLVNLCKNCTIPREFHEYYKTLPSSQSTKDILMEPDANETDLDTGRIDSANIQREKLLNMKYYY